MSEYADEAYNEAPKVTALEPGVLQQHHYDKPQLSMAVSLKRIADALVRIDGSFSALLGLALQQNMPAHDQSEDRTKV